MLAWYKWFVSKQACKFWNNLVNHSIRVCLSEIFGIIFVSPTWKLNQHVYAVSKHRKSVPKKLTVLSYEDLGLCKHRMNGNRSLVVPQVFCLSPARTDSRHNHGFSQIHLFHCNLQDNMGSLQILHKIMGHVAHKQGEPVANVTDIMQVKIFPKNMLKLL